MIDIKGEFTWFKTTKQRFADQAWMIIKQRWFSDLEVLEMSKQIIRQLDSNAITDKTQKAPTESKRQVILIEIP